MYTYLKTDAVKILKTGFYPQRVLEKFLTKHKKDHHWAASLNSASVLSRYIDCIDVRFFGHEEMVKKNQRKYYSVCGITEHQMKKFIELNHILLLDVHENTTNEKLKDYYKILIYLSGDDGRYNYSVSERQKLKELFHRKQAKLIDSFVSELPTKEELRDFIIISVLLSQGELLHDITTRQKFISLCEKVVD